MSVISLTERGAVGERLRAAGIDVRALEMSRRIPSPVSLLRLANWYRELRPQVVQTWMYHGDLIGGLTARLARSAPVVWNIRHTDLHPATTSRATRLTMTACAHLSRVVPYRIVCCAEAARRVHVAEGYEAHRMLVIPNGVDATRFRPDSRAAADVGRELGVSDVKLVGLVARFHAQKDHETFVRAAAQVRQPDVHFVLCGEEVTKDNTVLRDWIAAAGIGERTHLLGMRDDVPRITASLDVAVSSSSYGEGASNSLLEAMACGVACVTTDVGDAEAIVGETGWVVPARSPDALASALRKALESPAQLAGRGRAARARVEGQFTLAAMQQRYETLYAEVAGR